MSPRITQMNANKLERNIGNVCLGFHALRFRNAFVLQAWVVPKIHEKTKFKPGCVQIVQELCAMIIGQYGNGFQLNNNFLEARVIRPITLR
jgi:hypothetical protein